MLKCFCTIISFPIFAVMSRHRIDLTLGLRNSPLSSLQGVEYNAALELYIVNVTKPCGAREYIGAYSDLDSAVLVHDLESIRLFHCEASSSLNRCYGAVLQDNDHSKVECVIISHQNDNIRVEPSGDKFMLGDLIHLSYLDIDTAIDEFEKMAETNSPVMTPFINCVSVPSGIDSSRSARWSERVNAGYIVPVAFAFDVTFNTSHSLGLNLRPQMIPYPHSKVALGCCTVIDAASTSALHSIVYPGINNESAQELVCIYIYIYVSLFIGDLLLKINESSLVYDPNDTSSDGTGSEELMTQGFRFENLTKIIVSTNAPRTIRFMRLAGTASNLLPSPSEIVLLQQSTTPSARFSVVSATPNGSIELTWIDPQVLL